MTAKPGYSAAVKALAAFLADKPGVAAFKYSQNVTMYKVTDKIFAIFSMKAGYVVLKTHPDSIDMLKTQYKGIGHKTHLDHRHWIAVELNADVPLKEAKRLVALSYDLVREAAAPKRKAAKKPAARRARKAV